MRYHFITLTWTLNFLSLISTNVWCEDDVEEKIENEKNCREKDRLISSNNGDSYALIDVVNGEKLVLQCHYW